MAISGYVTVRVSAIKDEDIEVFERKLSYFTAYAQPHHGLKMERLLMGRDLRDCFQVYTKSSLPVPGGMSILLGVRVDPELEKLLEKY